MNYMCVCAHALSVRMHYLCIMYAHALCESARMHYMYARMHYVCACIMCLRMHYVRVCEHT